VAAREPSAPPPQDGGRRTTLGDDDLAADMQAILSGQKVYDPETKKVRPPGGAARAAEPAAVPERPVPEARNDQAIFDRIAQSMEHANSFDLGSVELGRRFGGFDQAHERHRAAPRGGRASAASVAPAKPAPVSPGAFVEDLAAITRDRSTPLSREELRSAYGRQGPWSGTPGRDSACGASSLALVLAPERSTAMYDTGEHVLAAGDLYPDRLVLAGSPGVASPTGRSWRCRTSTSPSTSSSPRHPRSSAASRR
jgi:hypothetical protein